MDETTALLVALFSSLTGLGGLFLSVYKARSSIHKETVETQSLARKTDVEALSCALQNLRADYDRLDERDTEQQRAIEELEQEVSAWKRRFDRVCQHVGVIPDEFITRPLGNRGGEPVGGDEPDR